MPKLNQIIAIEKGVKTRVYKFASEVYKAFQKKELFNGFGRSYQAKDEDGDKLPTESKRVQRNAFEQLNVLASTLTELFDVTATKDWGNTVARANIVVDGDILLEGVPSTYMLFLEKQLNDMKDEINKIPELDPTFEWKNDGATGVFRASTVESTKTKKVQKPIVLYNATAEHPAQTQLISEDVVVGTWSLTPLSGAMPTPQKQQLQERITRLIKAVKYAREEANNTFVEPREVAEPIFNFLLGE